MVREERSAGSEGALPRVPLTQVQVIAVRFLLPSVLLGIAVWIIGANPNSAQPVKVFAGAAFLAFAPLWILYHVLGNIQLQRLCIWETLIPALIFVASLWWKPGLFGTWPMLGLVLISAGYIIYEGELLSRRARAAANVPLPR